MTLRSSQQVRCANRLVGMKLQMIVSPTPFPLEMCRDIKVFNNTIYSPGSWQNASYLAAMPGSKVLSIEQPARLSFSAQRSARRHFKNSDFQADFPFLHLFCDCCIDTKNVLETSDNPYHFCSSFKLDRRPSPLILVQLLPNAKPPFICNQLKRRDNILAVS